MGNTKRNIVLASRYFRNKIKSAPVHLAIEVTKRCNAKCRFCDYWKEVADEKQIDFTRLQKMIKPVLITLTGGEPLLRKDLPALVCELRANDPWVYLVMITNGFLLTRDKATELKEAGLDQISISLDYIGRKHDLHRGVPGLYEKLIKVIPEIVKLEDVSVSFNTVIMDDNLEHIPEILRLTENFGMRITFSSYSLLKNNDQTFVVKAENKAKLGDMLALIMENKKRNRRLIISSVYYLKNVAEYFEGTEIPGCKAGTGWIVITPDGNIKRCSDFFPESDVASYSFRSLPPTPCTRCWYSCRGEAQSPVNYERVKELFL
jgi:MoaA/NifB/PqqE/SkfB family radical SAM enzyme